MSYDDGRAMLASSPAPAPAEGGPSPVLHFVAVLGAGLATMLGWRSVEHAIHRRMNRPGPRLLDQFGRPIGKGRR